MFYIVGDTIELRSLIFSSVISNITLLLYLLVVKLAIIHRSPPVLIDLKRSTIWNHAVILLWILSESVHLGIRICLWPSYKCVIAFLVYPPTNRGYHITCLFWLFYYHLMTHLVSDSYSPSGMVSNSLFLSGFFPLYFAFMGANFPSGMSNSWNKWPVPSDMDLSTQIPQGQYSGFIQFVWPQQVLWVLTRDEIPSNILDWVHLPLKSRPWLHRATLSCREIYWVCNPQKVCTPNLRW